MVETAETGTAGIRTAGKNATATSETILADETETALTDANTAETAESKKKYRRDATGVAWLGGMTERRRTLAVMGATARSTWADHPSVDIPEGKPDR